MIKPFPALKRKLSKFALFFFLWAIVPLVSVELIMIILDPYPRYLAPAW